MAHKKAGGSSKNGRDSNPQYRGVKRYAGEVVKSGSILVRQCGTRFHAGEHVGKGRDHTLYAKATGKVCFLHKGPKRGLRQRRYVAIIPLEEKLSDQVIVD